MLKLFILQLICSQSLLLCMIGGVSSKEAVIKLEGNIRDTFVYSLDASKSFWLLSAICKYMHIIIKGLREDLNFIRSNVK